jgi:hypothetical protein
VLVPAGAAIVKSRLMAGTVQTWNRKARTDTLSLIDAALSALLEWRALLKYTWDMRKFIGGGRADAPTVFFCVLILVAFVYGTYWMNREGARARQSEELRTRILTYINQHPEAGEVSLDALRQADVLQDADVDFMQSNGSVYCPISARSPGDAVFFIVRRSTEETRYYKNGTMEYRRNWISPNQRYTLNAAPHPQVSTEKRVCLVEATTGRVLMTHDVEASAVQEAFWSADSRYVAVTLHRFRKGEAGHEIDCGLVLDLEGPGIRRLSLPEEVQPDCLLAPEDAARKVRWQDHWVMAKGWHGHELHLSTEGRGRFDDPNHKGITVSLLYDFIVRMNEGGTSAVIRKTQRHYARSPSR